MLNKLGFKHKKEDSAANAVLGGATIGGTLGAAAGFSKILNTAGDAKFNKHFSDNKYLLPVYALMGALAGGNAGLGLHELKKHAAKKEEESFVDKHKASLTGAAVALGTFALARHGFNKTPDQIASKGKLTWALATEGAQGKALVKPKTVGEKLTKWLRYGDTEFVDVRRPATGKMKIDGAVYQDADITPGHYFPKGSINYNADSRVVNDVLQTKSEFGKLKGEMMIPTRKLTEAHPRYHVGLSTPESFAANLAKSKKDYYYKPSVDEMSGGWGHFTTEDLKRIGTDKRFAKQRSEELTHFYKNRKDYIAQDKIDLKIIQDGPDAGRPVTERRVHFGVDTEGKVNVITPKSQRWVDYKEISGKDINTAHASIAGAAIGGAAGASTGKDNKEKAKRFVAGAAIGGGAGFGVAKALNASYAVPKMYMKADTKELQKGIQEVWDRNPKLRSKSPAVYGADVVRDTKGKPWVIEVNDQSGFFHGDITAEGNIASHKLYKHITGRDTTTMATGKAIIAGGATAAVMKSQERKKNKAA